MALPSNQCGVHTSHLVDARTSGVLQHIQPLSEWTPSSRVRLDLLKPIGLTVRRGTAAVELAVCLPLLLLLVLGSIECCGMIFLSQSLHISTYEGARVAIQAQATNADVLARSNEPLIARNVHYASFTLDPPDVSSVAGGETITVSVSVPCDANSILPLRFFTGRTLSAQTTMVKQ